MAGVRSGGRRCGSTHMAAGTQNPGIAWMVRVMSAALMFPKTPHTSTMSAGTASAYQTGCDVSPSTIRTRSATPAGLGGRSRAKATSAGSSSTSSAETSAPLGWVATTSITSRPWPAHRLTIRIGPGWVSGPGTPRRISSSAARTMDCTARSRSNRVDDGSS